MNLQEVKDEIKKRQAMAQAIHERESKAEFPNIREKECSWGKLVAYNKCLELLSTL
jgi:hypothetical protein